MSRDQSKLITEATINGQINGVYYYPQTSTVFSGERLTRFVGIADSRPIDGGSIFAWHQLKWEATVPNNTRIYVFVRTGTTAEVLEEASWQGPYLNNTGEDISHLKDRFIQFRIAMYAQATTIETAPVVIMNVMQVTCYLNGDGVTFYTKLFDLSFEPKHILVTYRGHIPEGALVRFAVAGKESVNQDDYQIITPNTISNLSELPDATGKLKLRIDVSGPASNPVVINDFGFLVSGAGRKKIP